MANKIAAIGKRDAILPYKAIGVEIYITEEKNEFKTIIEKLVKEKYAIVLVTEEIAEKYADIIKEYNEYMIPSIIPVPGTEGSTGYGARRLREAVKKAVGADIYAE